MGYERLVAGIFAGAGGLLSIYLGATQGIEALIVVGSNLLVGIMAFFVGEKNGETKATAST